jgi:hypothetical protein
MKPALNEKAVRALQKAFDERRLQPGMNISTARGLCEEQIPAGIGKPPKTCSHQHVLQIAARVKCNLEHTHKDVTLRLCLLHFLERVELYKSPQMDLTDPADVAAGRKRAEAVDGDAAARKIAAAAKRNGSAKKTTSRRSSSTSRQQQPV